MMLLNRFASMPVHQPRFQGNQRMGVMMGAGAVAGLMVLGMCNNNNRDSDAPEERVPMSAAEKRTEQADLQALQPLFTKLSEVADEGMTVVRANPDGDTVSITFKDKQGNLYTAEKNKKDWLDAETNEVAFQSDVYSVHIPESLSEGNLPLSCELQPHDRWRYLSFSRLAGQEPDKAKKFPRLGEERRRFDNDRVELDLVVEQGCTIVPKVVNKAIEEAEVQDWLKTD